ncbi:hypothetical protein ACXIUT_03260 [Achromobacter denitrificans]
MRWRLYHIVFAFGALASFSNVRANECDCTKIVGQCLGSIEFVKGFGSKPSYGAEIVVHSSEKVCSKVEYTVNRTPYQTILANRQREPESLFGTAPISSKSVAFSACYVCAKTGATPSQPSTPSASNPAAAFIGSWAGSEKNFMGFSSKSEFQIRDAGGTLSGVMTSDGHPATMEAITVAGNTLTFVYQSDSGKGTGTLTLTGPDTMTGLYKAGGFSFTGSLKRQ